MKYTQFPLLNAWKESVQVFTPSQGKLFFLVTLKSVLEAYKILFLKFWWLFLLCLGVDILYKVYTPYIIIGIVWYFLWCLLGMITFLTVRPSMFLKNSSYYIVYGWHFLDFVAYTFLARMLWGLIVDGLHHGIFMIPAAVLAAVTFMIASPAMIPTIYVSPFLMILVLFSLDSKGEPWLQYTVPWRALKMIVYNYPFFLVITLLTIHSWMALKEVLFFVFKLVVTSSEMLTIFEVIANDVAKLVLPIFFCCVASYYTKQVHANFARYK